MRRIIAIALALGLFTVAVAGCSRPDPTKKGAKGKSSDGGNGGNKVLLEGAGASFPAIIYQKWFKSYKEAHSNVQIDYQSVGSGQGISRVIDETVDFGASDAAMSEEAMKKVKRGVVLIPMTAGSIVLAYNLEGIKDLKLSREAYAGIFLGKVTKWNDDLIKKSNPGVDLPDMKINVVVRSDSSGTTYVFTKHLSAISKEFAKSPGTDKLPSWHESFVKGAQNAGVTSNITRTPGSIGYIEYGYAKKLSVASLENKSGKFVEPNIESFQATLAGVEMPKSLVVWMPDTDAEKGYPIVSYTWLLCYEKYSDADKAKALKDVIKYCLTEGQKISEEMGYVPLPTKVVETIMPALDRITVEGEKAAAIHREMPAYALAATPRFDARTSQRPANASIRPSIQFVPRSTVAVK